MSKLSGQQILEEIRQGRIRIDPFDEKQLNPNSYNLRLGPQLLVYEVARYRSVADDTLRALAQVGAAGADLHGSALAKAQVLDMKAENPTHRMVIPEHGLVLLPGVCYLGHTLEYTETPEHIPVIEGRSSVGRLGISVHLTTGFGDCGFRGDWTLEIAVTHPVRVYAGVEICQIAYETIEGNKDMRYHGKYQGQRGPKASGLWRDFLK